MARFTTLGFPVALGVIPGIRMSWAILRRGLTGQAPVDELEDSR